MKYGHSRGQSITYHRCLWCWRQQWRT